MFHYDPIHGEDVARELTFEAQFETELRGETVPSGYELTIQLPRPITRTALDDMAGEGGPWGWGGYTLAQIEELEAGRF